MKREVVVLAIAKVADDYVIVCIPRFADPDREWIRLRKASGKISESDLKLRSGERMQPLDVVSLDTAKAGPGADYVWDTSEKADLVMRLEAEARTDFLNANARRNTDRLEWERIPFALVGPVHPTAVFTKSGSTCKAEFAAPELADGKPFQIVDPKWIELGYSFLSRSQEIELDSEYLERALGIYKLYTVVAADGDSEFSVLCVHTIPDYSTELYFPMI